MSKLRGAYVQAWVWVRVDELDPDAPVVRANATPGESVGNPGEPVNGEFRRVARDKWQADGEVEVDDNAGVSRSYDGRRR